MRKRSFVWLYALIFQSCHQSEKMTDRSILAELSTRCGTSANRYIESAESDFRNNTYRLFLFGLIETHSFTDYYSVYLETHSDINVIYAGCVSDTFLFQYNAVMEQNIKQKYGADYLENTRRTAKGLYEKTKK